MRKGARYKTLERGKARQVSPPGLTVHKVLYLAVLTASHLRPFSPGPQAKLSCTSPRFSLYCPAPAFISGATERYSALKKNL